MKMKNLVFRCVLAVASLAVGTAKAALYDVTHNFNLNLGANNVYRGAWAWSADFYAKSISQGVVHNSTLGSEAFNPPSNDNKSTAAVSGLLAASVATSQYTANANGTGSHEVSGSAVVFGPDGITARAYSASTLALNMGVRQPKGQIRWQPNWSVDAISGSVGIGDPLSIQVFDPQSGNLLSSATLWDLELNIADGTASWNNGNVSINGDSGSGTFSIAMDSAYITSGTGDLSVSWDNGLITASDCSGIWSGLLPAVGASAALNMQLGDATGSFDIGYDFGLTGDYSVQATIGASGFAQEAVPEPASLIAWAVLGATGLIVYARRRRGAKA
ncbi:MAG: hypothetical protein ACLP9L_11150 [Thermoguttaceae bacterium]